ncbi:hypothetical protein [Hyphomonas sp.]|uniref:hypothetical protein n=1 Tax=Hyphomonas sp. TaxID=87 RepID=UPI0035295F93
MIAGRRLFIVDPSLTDIRGHHYTLTRSVTESARLRGFDVHWLSAAEVSGDLLQHKEILPTFGLSMYAAYKGSVTVGGNAPLDRLKRLGARLLSRPEEPAAPEPSSEDKFEAVEVSIRDGLRQAIDTYGIGPADRLLFHTADGATYRALAEVIAGLAKDDLPLFHVCTPYDPVGVMPNRRSADEIMEVIDSLKQAGLVDRKVFLYAENPFLADHLAEIWKVPVRPLDLPMKAVTEDEKFLARKFRTERLKLDENAFVITSLGAARLEKGFNLIPDVVQRTFEFAGTPGFPNAKPESIKFVLQASAQIIGRHPVIAKAIERLQELPSTQVELLLEPLTDQDYRNMLITSDAVLMPYEEQAYRVRGSGVVTEAVTARKFIVAKSGTYPARMAELQGGATGETPREMAQSLVSIINNRWERFEPVKAGSIQYLRDNSIESYVPKLIAAERRGMAGRMAAVTDAHGEDIRPV